MDMKSATIEYRHLTFVEGCVSAYPVHKVNVSVAFGRRIGQA